MAATLGVGVGCCLIRVVAPSASWRVHLVRLPPSRDRRRSLTDDRRKGSVIRTLPWRAQQKVPSDFDDFKRADAMIDWTKTKASLETGMTPKANSSAHAALVMEELGEEGQQELAEMLGDATTEETNVVLRRGQRRQAQRGGAGGEPWQKRPAAPAGERSAARAPPRLAAEPTCPN